MNDAVRLSTSEGSDRKMSIMTPLRTIAPLLLCAACGGETLSPLMEAPYVPPPERCEAGDVSDVHTFAYCNRGSGIFGEWQLDEVGLPSYFYGLDQNRDARAGYPVSEKTADGSALDPRAHWWAFGNRRINAMQFNDGYVEVVTQDRGVAYLNKRALEQGNVAGGFGYLDDGEAAWSTAYRERPYGALTTRRFGMGWAESSMEHRGVRMTRTLAAPPGTLPLLDSRVVLENVGDEPKTLSHYEVWDVGRRPIEINWVVSGELLTGAPESARAARDERNGMFSERVRYSDGMLVVEREHAANISAPPMDVPDATDHYPSAPFLVSLGDAPDAVYVDQARFFGSGGVAHPDAVVQRLGGDGDDGVLAEASALGQPHVLVMRHDVSLAPGERVELRYGYGYSRWGETPDDSVGALRAIDDTRVAYQAALGERLFYFVADRDPALQRELAWHSYQLETSVGQRDYWQGAVVPQGSAYLYLHGADGAARDLGLFAVPLVYTDPQLAKAELALFMGIQRASDGAFSYAFQGHGMIDDAGIHTAPSDLPLFFLWALGEYLGATGDSALLDAPMPFYPRDAQPGATVFDHVQQAALQLLDVIGSGPHGLIRVQTGDWSDGIVVEAPNRELAVEAGESIPNTQMAVAVLPRMIALIEPRDAALATRLRDALDGYRGALASAHNGTFYYRAYFGDDEPVDADDINLEAQVWALIGDGMLEVDARARLIEAIDALRTPIGAALWRGGQVWPAISALLSWGYAQSDPERAWQHLSDNSMTSHALAFPDVWYGIWSGPDGVSSTSGHAWASQVTPMTDFPVQNNNAHAMPILAALRVAGVNATHEGLRIAPISADEPFALSCKLLDLSLRGDRLTVRYRPLGKRQLVVVAPAGTRIASADYDGQALEVTDAATLRMDARADAELVVTLAR